MRARRAALPIVRGCDFGLTGALVLTRFIAGQLYGVGPTDPLTFAAVTALLLGTALLASWLPARRAAGVEPLVTLQQE